MTAERRSKATSQGREEAVLGCVCLAGSGLDGGGGNRVDRMSEMTEGGVGARNRGGGAFTQTNMTRSH